MKEHPILFSAPMVRALLDGTKTQTRRVVKLHSADCVGWFDDGDGLWRQRFIAENGSPYLKSWSDRCPYGQPGDRLWVRETWAEVARAEPRTDEDLPWREDRCIVVYAADQQWDGARQFLCADGVLRWAKPDRWKPSIHMPRWASRILLEVTAVRVERLQAINEVDAIAEGAPWAACGSPQDGSHKAGYAQLWESINGPDSWAANPWVWVIEFKRVQPIPANCGSGHCSCIECFKDKP